MRDRWQAWPRGVRAFIGVTALSAAWFAAGCDRAGETAAGGGAGTNGAAAVEPVSVRVAPVQRRAVARTVDVTGTLFGAEEADIAAKVGGRVVAVEADLGDVVPPGGILARIEPTDYELAAEERRTAMLAALAEIGLRELPTDDFDPETVPTVQRARADAVNARDRYQRVRTLYEQSPPAASGQELNDARTQMEMAESGVEVERLAARAALATARTRAAELVVAQQRLEDTLVRAPAPQPTPGWSVGSSDAAGASVPDLHYEVAQRLVSLGEYVNAGQPLFRLVASDPIKFRADVPERYVDDVRVGQEARVRVEAFAEPVAGRVARVSPQIVPASRSFEIEIHLPNADGRLRPGAFARGSVTTHVEEGMAFVPEEAVVTFAGVRKVFSVRDGKAVEHRVETGAREDGWVEIRADSEIDTVVIDNPAALADGTPVAID